MIRVSRCRRLAGHDDGTVLVMAVGGVLLVLAVVLVLADASSLFMRRTALMTVADNAALAAANAIDVDAIYASGVGSQLQLDPAQARTFAQDAVASADDPRLQDVQLDSIDVAGSVATVVVSARVSAPLSDISGTRSLRLRARASASTPTRF